MRKPVFRGLQPDKIQTSLLSYRVLYYLGSEQQRSDQTAQADPRLMLAYGMNRFSHGVAHLLKNWFQVTLTPFFFCCCFTKTHPGEGNIKQKNPSKQNFIYSYSSTVI